MGGNGDHENLFRHLAGAIQEHLDLRQTVDEGKVHEIAVAEIVKARMPRPLAITVNDRPTGHGSGLVNSFPLGGGGLCLCVRARRQAGWG